MKTMYSIARGQSEFPALVRAAQRRGVATITRHDEPVAYLVSREKWESMLETMELLADEGFQRQWRKIKAGKVKYYSLESIPD